MIHNAFAKEGKEGLREVDEGAEQQTLFIAEQSLVEVIS